MQASQMLVPQLLVLATGSWIAGRLLGIRVTAGRWAFSLLVGSVSGAVIAWVVAGRPADPRSVSGVVAVVATFLSTLAVVADPFALAGPPGRLADSARLLPVPARWWRALRGRVARGRRYVAVLRIARRHGLLRGARRAAMRNRQGTSSASAGRALAGTLEEAGGAFVKLGQILSTRIDLLPAEVTSELARLQDDVEPIPPAAVEALILEELGAAAGEVFAEFDPHPVASASIAQVHAARLHTGERVAVKLQRPEVAGVIERDLEITARLAAALEARTSWGRGLGATHLAAGLAAALREEIDFRVEGQNTATCRAGLATDAAIAIPAVHPALTTRRVLVVDWVEGVSVRLADARGLIADGRRSPLARDLLATVLHQILVFGVFHADPHPGNVLLTTTGQLAMVDFGAVGRLDSSQRSVLLRALLAITQGDVTRLTEAFVDLSARPAAVDEDLVQARIGQFMAYHLVDDFALNSAAIKDLMGVILDLGLVMPQPVAGVFRALVTLEGTLRTLDPAVDLLEESRGLVEAWRPAIPTTGSLRAQALQESLTVLPLLRRLPRRLDRISADLERGRLQVNVSLLASPRDRRIVGELVDRALLVVMALGLGGIAIGLLAVGDGAGVPGVHLLGVVSLVGSVVLCIRALVAILRPRH